MAQYTVRYGETLQDVCYNATGALTSIDAIMDLNGFDTYTPLLTPGQVLEVPDVVYDSDAVAVANVRPFNSACALTEEQIKEETGGAEDNLGDLPGPDDDETLDPVPPPEGGTENYLAIQYRVDNSRLNLTIWVKADYAVTSDVTCHLNVYNVEPDADVPEVSVDVTIPTGSKLSNESTIEYHLQNRIQFKLNGVIPIEDYMYSYQAGYPVEIY